MRNIDWISEYEQWLLDFIQLDDHCERYGRLLDFLSGIPFTWKVAHDDNRAEDGFSLRWRFASEYIGCDDNFWIDRLPVRCSVLEMMIALAMRCDDIMYEPEKGCRVAVWFWRMIANMGLFLMTDRNFDRDICAEIVRKFLDRKYEKNGKGGLFVTNDPEIDMRKSEIWYQMNIWLEEKFNI